MNDITAILPMIALGVSAFLVLLLTVAGGQKKPAPDGASHLTLVALAGLFAAGFLMLTRDGGSLTAFSGAVVVDGLGVVFGLIALIGAFVAVLLATAYLDEHELSHGEFLALILFCTLGMFMLVWAGDLMVFFIGLEVMSMAVYILAGFRRASRRSQEAALKYFIYGAYASAFILFGIALIYGEVGRLSGKPAIGFEAIGLAFGSGEISLVGWSAIGMLIAGLAFKVAAVPFHMWAPDVYEGAPTPATAFMAVGVKTAAFAGLIRFLTAVLQTHSGDRETQVQLFELLAVLTMVVGNFLAIRQNQIKRMLAYSSIAHAGYLLVGVAAYMVKPTGEALNGMAFYLLAYTAMTLGAFGVVLAFERKDDRRLDLAIRRLRGIGHRYPTLGLALALFMFSLAGVPPTAGFFGKLALFSAAVDAGRVPVVIIAVLASVVGAYYYLNVLVTAYMRADDTDEEHFRSPWLSAGLWLCAAMTVVFGILPESSWSFFKHALSGWLS